MLTYWVGLRYIQKARWIDLRPVQVSSIRGHRTNCKLVSFSWQLDYWLFPTMVAVGGSHRPLNGPRTIFAGIVRVIYIGYSGMPCFAVCSFKLAYLMFRRFCKCNFPVWGKMCFHSRDKLYSHEHTVVLAARVWSLYGKHVQISH